MELITKTLLAALVVGALGTVITIQRASLSAEKERAQRAEKTLSERDAAINTLTDAAANNRKALAKLQADRQGIAATLSARELFIENLQHENIAIRNWAESPLPDAIAGLRERPALTGADAYRQRLSGGDPLQPAGDRPQD